MVDTLRDILNVLKDHGGRIRTLETLPRNASTTIISEGGAVEEGPGIDIPDGTSRVGVGEDSVLLVFNDQRPAEEYVFGSSGLDNAINSAGDGDQVRIQGVGTIPNNHAVPNGTQLRGLGYSSVLSGIITLGSQAILANVRVQGGITGFGLAQNVVIDTFNVLVGAYRSEIDPNGSFSGIVTGESCLINGDHLYNFIGGGSGHEISTVADTAYYNTICGGESHELTDGAESGGSDHNFIGGGYDHLITDASHAVIVGGYNHEMEAGGSGIPPNYCAIVGGRQHTIYDSEYAGIVAGRANNISDGGASSICQYAFIGAGYSNNIYDSSYATIVCGEANTIGDAGTSDSSDYAAIVGGDSHTILSGISSIIGGGSSHTIDTSEYSGIFSGRLNTITGDYASILGGYQGVADKYGQQTHSAGEFAADGDAQRSDFVARRSVTHSDANWYELYLDGTTNALLTISADTVWTFVVLIAGTTQGCTKSFSFRIEGAIENDGGTTTILASTVTTIYDTDDVSFDARVSADDANDALLVEVQDSDGSSDVVRWVASIRTAEVTFPA